MEEQDVSKGIFAELDNNQVLGEHRELVKEILQRNSSLTRDTVALNMFPLGHQLPSDGARSSRKREVPPSCPVETTIVGAAIESDKLRGSQFVAGSRMTDASCGVAR